MTVLYEFTDPRGSIHDIKEVHLQDAFRTLVEAGYDRLEAHDKSLDFLLAKITISAIPETDLLYGAHNYHEEMRLCSLVTHRLMIKTQQQKETNGLQTQE